MVNQVIRPSDVLPELQGEYSQKGTENKTIMHALCGEVKEQL